MDKAVAIATVPAAICEMAHNKIKHRGKLGVCHSGRPKKWTPCANNEIPCARGWQTVVLLLRTFYAMCMKFIKKKIFAYPYIPYSPHGCCSSSFVPRLRRMRPAGGLVVVSSELSQSCSLCRLPLTGAVRSGLESRARISFPKAFRWLAIDFVQKSSEFSSAKSCPTV